MVSPITREPSRASWPERLARLSVSLARSATWLMLTVSSSTAAATCEEASLCMLAESDNCSALSAIWLAACETSLAPCLSVRRLVCRRSSRLLNAAPVWPISSMRRMAARRVKLRLSATSLEVSRMPRTPWPTARCSETASHRLSASAAAITPTASHCARAMAASPCSSRSWASFSLYCISFSSAASAWPPCWPCSTCSAAASRWPLLSWASA